MEGMVSMERDDPVDREAHSLWRTLTTEPPPPGVRGAELLDLILQCSDPVPYTRLHSPFLRDSQISRPKT